MSRVYDCSPRRLITRLHCAVRQGCAIMALPLLPALHGRRPPWLDPGAGMSTNDIYTDVVVENARKERDEAVAKLLKAQEAIFRCHQRAEQCKDSTEKAKALVAIFNDDTFSMEEASDALKNDREVVIAAVTRNGLALEYASNHLKNNKEVVMAAVKQYGYVLRYASKELQKDEDVLRAVTNPNQW